MKRNVILAVVVITALSLAGMGGVFATWSDSEISYDNTIETGALDLKVNGADDLPWGRGVPPKISVDHMIPCKYYGPFEVELWNAGQCDQPSHAYIHLKSYNCTNIPPKINPYPEGGSECWYDIYGPDATSGYMTVPRDPNYPTLKCEPELVAEWGGKVNCVEVPGIGAEGDECSLATHIELIATLVPLPPNDPYYEDFPEDLIHRDKIVKWECLEIYLFDLLPCQARTIYLWVHMQQDPEEMYGFNFIPNPGEPGYDLMHWKKFNDWPSWALMKDKIVFDLEFDLWLEDP